MGLFDAEGQSHNTVYALHRFMLCIYCMTMSRSRKGKRVLPNPWHKRLRNTHKQFAQKETGYYYPSLAKRLAKQIFLMHQSIPAAPSPPSPHGLLQGICPPCQSRGWGICKFCAARRPGICQLRDHSRAFDTHAVSYQNITTRRILLGKKADLLICPGHE